MKKARKVPVLAKTAVLAICAFFAVSLIHLQLEIADRQEKLAALDEQINDQKTVNEALRDQVENGVSDEYIASLARDLGYVSPGERVYVDSSSR